MYDKDTILARLQNGEDAQAIADEIADVLNEAVAAHIEAKEAAAKINQKVDAAQHVLDTVFNFIEIYYPEVYGDDLREFEGTDLIEMIDDAIAETAKVKKSIKNIEKLFEDLKKIEEETKKNNVKRDPIEEFLATYVGE